MKLRIIVVDPDESTQKLLTILLSRMGHELYATAELTSCPIYSGEDHQCSNASPCGDILILNNRMSRMSGLKLIEDQMTSGCKGASRNKLVLTSSVNSTEEIEYAKQLGCKILSIPFHIDDIRNWVSEIEKTIDPSRVLIDLG